MVRPAAVRIRTSRAGNSPIGRVSIAKAAAARNAASARSGRVVNARISAETIVHPAVNARNADLRTGNFRETNRIANRVASLPPEVKDATAISTSETAAI